MTTRAPLACEYCGRRGFGVLSILRDHEYDCLAEQLGEEE